jgi:hypothetical protein
VGVVSAKRKPAKKTTKKKKPLKITRKVVKATARGTGRMVRGAARAAGERLTREEIVKQASRDNWQKDFPDPRTPELVMTKVEPIEPERYEATFDGCLVMPFTIEPGAAINVRDAAIEEAERIYGPIVHNWILTYVEAVNETAMAVFPKGTKW